MRTTLSVGVILALLLGGLLAIPAAAQQAQVVPAIRYNVSERALRDIARAPFTEPPSRAPFAIPNKFRVGKPQAPQAENVLDPVVQAFEGTLAPSAQL